LTDSGSLVFPEARKAIGADCRTFKFINNFDDVVEAIPCKI